ncbi:hypothetical protein [Microbacterium sp. SORGH_AS_0888]|nr:hypothetical protein [Microbacterium sp. SORGH_AS_0888]MDQ1128331.1 hypothetical protein [Microbacterium sp. SORGH_AS_0888]
MFALVIFGVLALWAIVGTIVALATDGYRSVPTDESRIRRD